MSVYKRGDRWYYHVRRLDPVSGKVYESRRAARPDNTKADALRCEAEAEAAIRDMIDGREAPSELTLVEFVPEFLIFCASPSASRKGANRPGELREKTRTFDLHLIPFFGAMPLADIRPYHVDEYTAAKKAAGLTTKTINNHIGILRRLLKVAERRELIEKAPYIPHLGKAGEDKVTEDMVLTTHELSLLLSNTSPRWRPLVAFAVDTGLRLSELRALKWTDLHVRNGTPYVHVQRGLTNAGFGLPKSGQSRWVPFRPYIHEMLQQLPHHSEYVFSSNGRKCPTSHTHFAEVLTRATKKAGLTKHVHPHMLRHTFVTQCLMQGIPVRVIMGWSGHSSLSAFEVYSHFIVGAHDGEWVAKRNDPAQDAWLGSGSANVAKVGAANVATLTVVQ